MLSNYWDRIPTIALQVIAERLSEEEIGGLKELFKMIDTDDSGTITFDELKEGLRRVGSELMESEIKDLMDAADIDNSGTIDYGEFLAATVHLNKLEREENLVSAFSFFDKDGSGYITIDELQQACKEFGWTDRLWGIRGNDEKRKWRSWEENYEENYKLGASSRTWVSESKGDN
ncbi:Calcium-dependent protein kinase SK5 [Sesamum angolense]|uniref:Calcium-dependent protein kinase SK5 n=1 Tax=Sesamum angolense TaxID=2727404 RepID=A0AAE1WJ54_9LAMI|nr:Calcium-dependent protein kinase SK5 [Sesamum angolense]